MLVCWAPTEGYICRVSVSLVASQAFFQPSSFLGVYPELTCRGRCVGRPRVENYACCAAREYGVGREEPAMTPIQGTLLAENPYEKCRSPEAPKAY
jgi:hypothetical protein